MAWVQVDAMFGVEVTDAWSLVIRSPGAGAGSHLPEDLPMPTASYTQNFSCLFTYFLFLTRSF